MGVGKKKKKPEAFALGREGNKGRSGRVMAWPETSFYRNCNQKL